VVRVVHPLVQEVAVVVAGLEVAQDLLHLIQVLHLIRDLHHPTHIAPHLLHTHTVPHHLPIHTIHHLVVLDQLQNQVQAMDGMLEVIHLRHLVVLGQLQNQVQAMDGMLEVIHLRHLVVLGQLQNQVQAMDGMLEVIHHRHLVVLGQLQSRIQMLDGIPEVIFRQHPLDLHHHIQACKIVQFQAIMLRHLMLQVIITHQLTVQHILILLPIAHRVIDPLTVLPIVLHTVPLIVHPTIHQVTTADRQVVTFHDKMFMELIHQVLDITQIAIRTIMEILLVVKAFLETHTSQITIMEINDQVDQDF